jgi:hypothetical protein
MAGVIIGSGHCTGNGGTYGSRGRVVGGGYGSGGRVASGAWFGSGGGQTFGGGNRKATVDPGSRTGGIGYGSGN